MNHWNLFRLALIYEFIEEEGIAFKYSYVSGFYECKKTNHVRSHKQGHRICSYLKNLFMGLFIPLFIYLTPIICPLCDKRDAI